MSEQPVNEKLVSKLAALEAKLKRLEVLEQKVANLEEKIKDVDNIKDAVERVQETVSSVDKKAGELLEALAGSLKSKGLISRVLEVEDVVTGANGLLIQVGLLKDARTKMIGWAAGAVFVATSFAGLLIFVLEHFVIKKGP